MTENQEKQEKQSKYIEFFQKALDSDGRFENVLVYCGDYKSDYDSILINVPTTVFREKQQDVFFSRLKVDNNSYISFRDKYKYWFIKNNVETYSLISDPGFFRISLPVFDNLITNNSTELSKLIIKMFLNEVNYPPFGCCSKFVECSNQRKCIHRDFLYSTACMYRKNLERNKIFYGVNKNIDVSKKQYNFVACDVETADEENGYICSIGLATVNNNKIEKTNYNLIKPNCKFCERNVKIHGITEYAVANSPSFSQFWNEFHDIFETSIIVAHNAHFDLNVIKKEIVRNNIQINSITYIDTLQVARKYLNLEHHGLSDVCKELDINIENHHCALDDSIAAANILIKLLNKYNINLNNFIKKFDINDESNKSLERHKRKSNVRLSPSFEFFNVCPQNIDLKDITVCLSGDFESMSKTEFSNILDSKGAIVKKSVTKSLEYLVIGELGSEQWMHGSFGTKIEKALKYNCNGSNILIVREQDFLECSNMLNRQVIRNVPENISYIAPEGEWHSFESTEETMLFLKNHNMLAPTAVKLKNIYYNGVFTKGYTLCEVCGYVDDSIAVIKINDDLHCIDIDCLRDMQPTKAEKEEYNLL